MPYRELSVSVATGMVNVAPVVVVSDMYRARLGEEKVGALSLMSSMCTLMLKISMKLKASTLADISREIIQESVLGHKVSLSSFVFVVNNPEKKCNNNL